MRSTLATDGHQPPLKPQRVQVVVTPLDALEGGLRFVVFHEIMLNARRFGLREDARPIDGAFADVSNAAGDIDRRAKRALVSARNSAVRIQSLTCTKGKRPGYFSK